MIFRSDRPARIRWTILLSAALLFVGYQAINAFVPNGDMILATRVLALGFYTTVLAVYAPEAWRSIINGQQRTDFLIAGIWISFLSHAGQSLYSVAYRLAPTPWLLNSEVVSPIVLLSVIASTLHVGYPGLVDGKIPRKNRITFGICVGAATCCVAALLVTRPDIGPLLDRARPYISDWWTTGMLGSVTHGRT